MTKRQAAAVERAKRHGWFVLRNGSDRTILMSRHNLYYTGRLTIGTYGITRCSYSQVWCHRAESVQL